MDPVGDDLDFAIAHSFPYRSSPRKGGLISLYVDSLAGSPLRLPTAIVVDFETYPPLNRNKHSLGKRPT
ncbi:propionate--CoA ligase [Limnospira fusiformis]|uniref:propionate--CoA ligase n=1 Tax=Limnospira fusiformis TaxID=54297 RepID=UPI001449759D|nr:propionate--CoA ligase [Limnospira fusiformis SAG 85.79]